MIFQKFNNRTKRWVKYKKNAKGQTTIMNVKQQEPTKPFKGVPKK